MLAEFGPSLYSADGPTISFFGFPYPTRMALACFADRSVWVWSPIALTEQLAREVETLGRVRYIVSPNKLHHLFLPKWADRWPEAKLYAPPGLARKERRLRFEGQLHDQPDPAWFGDIDQVVFRGSFAMQEVVFFHRPSSTAIFGDLIQRFPDSSLSGWKRTVMRLGGLVGQKGGTPIDWRSSFLWRAPARAARERVLQWNPSRLLIAHGECAQSGARQIIADALKWM
jgi:hypothetical protein